MDPLKSDRRHYTDRTCTLWTCALWSWAKRGKRSILREVRVEGVVGIPAIRFKCRVDLVWLIRRLLCRLTEPNTVSTMQLRNYGSTVRFIAIELTELTCSDAFWPWSYIQILLITAGKISGALCVIFGAIIITPLLPIIGSKFSRIQEQAKLGKISPTEIIPGESSSTSEESVVMNDAVESRPTLSVRSHSARSRSVSIL